MEDQPRAGDLLGVERTGFVSGMIHLGQWIRPSLRPWAKLTHWAYVRTDGGHLIEALTRGVVRSHISKYDGIRTVVIHTNLDPHDLEQANAFADSCVGMDYGWLTDASIGLRNLTPGRGWWFGMTGTQMCSGFCAETQVRGPTIYPAEPGSMQPAELGRHYNVQPKETECRSIVS
jgi:hypothetical protein